jgi:hypothetical protein
MAPRRLKMALAIAALPLGLAACPSSEGEEPLPPEEPKVVLGVQAEDFGGLVNSVRISAKVDGAVLFEQSIAIGPGAPPGGLPKEIELKGAAGAKAEIKVEGFAQGNATAIVSRIANAQLLPSPNKKLLRVNLEARCASLPAAPGTPPSLSCAPPLTCVAARCVTSDVRFDDLEDYDPNWASAPPDICRPAKRGPPEVVLGTGQTDYSPVTEGMSMQLEKGPQGGHHLWVAVRMRNLRQSGSITTITSKIEGDPNPVPPAAYVFTFDRDEGAFCKLWGLRYQLDVGAQDLTTAYKRFLGKRLAVTVEVKDSTGAIGTQTKTVQIADKILCPDGTTNCNN